MLEIKGRWAALGLQLSPAAAQRQSRQSETEDWESDLRVRCEYAAELPGPLTSSSPPVPTFPHCRDGKLKLRTYWLVSAVSLRAYGPNIPGGLLCKGQIIQAGGRAGSSRSLGS